MIGRLLAGRRLRGACPFLVLALVATVASLWPEPFLLTREGLEHGELWRLWTGHLVHGSGLHLLLDVGAGLVLLALAAEWRFVLGAAPVVGLAVLAARPEFDAYCGLSGVLHGWTVLCAFRIAAERQRGTARFAALGIALGVLGKAAVEAALHHSLFTTDAGMGVPTVHEAHLIGALAGLVWFLAVRLHVSAGDGVAGPPRRGPVPATRSCPVPGRARRM